MTYNKKEPKTLDINKCERDLKGKTIRIDSFVIDNPYTAKSDAEYIGRVGKVEKIEKGLDGDVNLFGTWGSLAVILNKTEASDSISVLTEKGDFEKYDFEKELENEDDYCSYEFCEE